MCDSLLLCACSSLNYVSTLLRRLSTCFYEPSRPSMLCAGLRVGADESLDDGSLLAGVIRPPSSSHSLTGSTAVSHCQSSIEGSPLPPASLAALVVKPAVLGSFEAVERLVVWSRNRQQQWAPRVSERLGSASGFLLDLSSSDALLASLSCSGRSLTHLPYACL